MTYIRKGIKRTTDDGQRMVKNGKRMTDIRTAKRVYGKPALGWTRLLFLKL